MKELTLSQTIEFVARPSSKYTKEQIREILSKNLLNTIRRHAESRK